MYGSQGAQQGFGGGGGYGGSSYMPRMSGSYGQRPQSFGQQPGTTGGSAPGGMGSIGGGDANYAGPGLQRGSGGYGDPGMYGSIPGPNGNPYPSRGGGDVDPGRYGSIPGPGNNPYPGKDPYATTPGWNGPQGGGGWQPTGPGFTPGGKDPYATTPGWGGPQGGGGWQPTYPPLQRGGGWQPGNGELGGPIYPPMMGGDTLPGRPRGIEIGGGGKPPSGWQPYPGELGGPTGPGLIPPPRGGPVDPGPAQGGRPPLLGGPTPPTGLNPAGGPVGVGNMYNQTQAPNSNQLWFSDWAKTAAQKDPSLAGQRVNTMDPAIMAKFGFNWGPNGEWNGPLPDEWKNTLAGRTGFSGIQNGMMYGLGRDLVGDLDLSGWRNGLSQDAVNRMGTYGWAGMVPGGQAAPPSGSGSGVMPPRPSQGPFAPPPGNTGVNPTRPFAPQGGGIRGTQGPPMTPDEMFQMQTFGRRLR